MEDKRKILNAISATKCASTLRKLYNEAVAKRDRDAQKKILKKAQVLGIYIRRGKLTGVVGTLELHYNNAAKDNTSQNSHLASFNSKDEMLDPGTHLGVSEPGESTNCLWAENGWVSTLDKTSVTAPKWLGGKSTITSPKVPTDSFFDGILNYINAPSADVVDMAVNIASTVT
jgi:hypothetical protein